MDMIVRSIVSFEQKQSKVGGYKTFLLIIFIAFSGKENLCIT